MTFGMDRLKGAEVSGEAERAHLERVASGFRENADYERLVVVMDDDPAAFAVLPRVTRMSVGIYQQQREAARRLLELQQGGSR